MQILIFDLSNLERYTKDDPEYLVVALYKYFKGVKVPYSSKDKFPPVKGLENGSSFVVNPEAFFNNKVTDIVYKAQYIKLAGRRDYTLFKALGIKSLDLSMYPDIDLSKIKSNPLLKIANNCIKFKFEETQ